MSTVSEFGSPDTSVEPIGADKVLLLVTAAAASLAAGFSYALRDAAPAWPAIAAMAAPIGALTGASGLWIGLKGRRRRTATGGPQGEAPPQSLIEALQVMGAAFACWDAEGRMIAANPAFSRMFGLNAENLQPPSSHDQFARKTREMIRQSLNPADRGSGLREIEFHDGRWVQIQERRTPSGGLVLTAIDITSLKLREAERIRDEEFMRDAIDRLEDGKAQLKELAAKYETEKLRAVDANRSKSEFLANMSHEFRTPLNAIIGFSEIMRQELFGPLGARPYAGYVDDILTSGQHLLALVNDVLEMSKIEAGRMKLGRERLCVSSLVTEVISEVRSRAEASGLMLVVDIGDDLPEVETDARAVKQILLNLLSNAVKFTPAGGRVSVRVREEDGGVRLTVQDTGIGIDADDLPRLAIPFEQVESQQSKTTKGSGLGLALSKAFVEMLGSNLDIQSVPSRGTEVSFLLLRSGAPEGV